MTVCLPELIWWGESFKEGGRGQQGPRQEGVPRSLECEGEVRGRLYLFNAKFSVK